MSEVVTDFVNKYVAEYGILPAIADRPPGPQATETKPATTTAKVKRGKENKEAN